MINENQLQLQLNNELTNKNSILVLTANEIKLIKKINDPKFFQNLLLKTKKTIITLSIVKADSQLQANIPVDWTRNERIGGNIFEKMITPNTGSAIFLGFAQLSEKNSQLVYFNEADATIIASSYVYNEEIFKDRGCKFLADQKTVTDWTELHKIVSFGDLEELKIILNKPESKTALTTTTKQGSTPLHMAIWRGLPDRVECLLEKIASDNLSLAFTFLKYAELQQEPRLQICIALIKNILENARNDSLNNLQKNLSRFSLDLSSTTFNNLKIDIDTVSALFQLQKFKYVHNVHLWLRQLVFSLIIKPLQLQNRTNADQSTPLNEEQMVSLAKELSTYYTEISSMEFRSLFSGLWHQFSTKTDLTRANQEFKLASNLYSEAHLFLGYQFATGKGQPRNYNAAGACYFQAFTEISKESSLTQETAAYQSFLSDLKEAAIASLQNLYQQAPPTLADKAHISFLLAKCYSEQKNYQKVREQIEMTQTDFLIPQEQPEFSEIAAKAYYQLAAQIQNNEEKRSLLKKANAAGHGLAALTLAKMEISKQPQSDFFEAASYCIDALTATCSVNINEAINQFFSHIDTLLGNTDNEKNICDIVFKAAATILKNLPNTEKRWPIYKDFLQNLAERHKLPEKSKLIIEYVLFYCYRDDRAVTLKELGISYTKKMGMFTLKKSKEEIEGEKQQKIIDKLAALEQQDPLIAQRFSNVLASEPKEFGSDVVAMPLYQLVEAVMPQDPNLTLPTVQVIPTETPEGPSLSEQKNSRLEMEMELEKLKSELEKLRSENSALKNALQKPNDPDIAKVNAALKNQLGKSQKEITELKSKLTKAETTVARLSKSNSTWKRPKIELLKEEKNSKDEQNDQKSSSLIQEDPVTLNF